MKKPFPVKLLLEPEELRRVRHWYDKNKKNPVFKHLVIKAYRDWTAVVHINNKIVTETTIEGHHDGGASGVGRGATCERHLIRQR